MSGLGPALVQPHGWRLALDAVTSPGTLDQLMHCLDGLWVEHPEISEDDRADVTVAAFEICSNIIEHAGRGKPVQMKMHVRLDPEQIDLLFTDDGIAAYVDLQALVMPTELADRGRGLTLAKALVDEVGYRRDHDRNHWHLTRRLTSGFPRTSEARGID